jgi:hypothetical protein
MLIDKETERETIKGLRDLLRECLPHLPAAVETWLVSDLIERIKVARNRE